MKLLRIFYLKIYLDIIIGNSQPRELHCAICIGTLSFPIAVLVCREEASPALTPKWILEVQDLKRTAIVQERPQDFG